MTIAPTSPADVLVVGDGGLHGRTRRPPPGAAVPSTTEVVLSDGRPVVVPTHLLRPQPDGHFYLPLGPADLAATVAPGPSPVAAQVVPLVAEQLAVHTRRAETGRVRVTKVVETHEEVVDLPTVREEVTVERVPVGRFVDAVPPVRHEGDVTIISVVEEVLVVEKRLMVREEVRLTLRRTETRDAQTVTLRKEVAHVDRVRPD